MLSIGILINICIIMLGLIIVAVVFGCLVIAATWLAKKLDGE